jgi:surface antigen
MIPFSLTGQNAAMSCTLPLVPRLKGKEVSLSVKTLVPFVVGLILGGVAQAQLLPTWETHITLTQRDLDMIREAVTNQVHGKPVGTTASWNNAASGNSGSIKLVKKLSRKNQQCEDIEYTVRSSGPSVYTEHYHFISCLQPDGTWKIA